MGARAFGPVAVVATGTANLASVLAALRRAGADPVPTRDPAVVASAQRVVLPGVGAFGEAMRVLRGAGLVDVVRDRIESGRATLGICLGLQIFAEASEETPGVEGLGVIPGVVRAFPEPIRAPQLGWNRVWSEGRVGRGDAYFAHSYRLLDAPADWTVAWADHGGPFVAAVERGDVLGCQFHPELSGAWGATLIERWLRGDRTPLDAPDRSTGLRRRILPCLDVRDGRVVKGVRFQGLRDAGDPVALAAAYAAQGADELVLLDVSATPEGRDTAVETVRGVRAVLDVPLTVGGGIRSASDAARLLEAGADKVGVNSAAVARPQLLAELAEAFGRQCVVLAVDAARRDDHWEIVVHSGKDFTGRDALEWVRQGVALGAGEILLTSWDRDGTRDGYDLELVRAVSDAVRVPVVASGGADGPQHLVEAVEAGADAVLAASIFHEGQYTVGSLKDAMAKAGVEVRQ